MITIYRISDSGYNKVKPDYINNKNCLKNACIELSNTDKFYVIADNVSPKTKQMIEQYVDKPNITYCNIGNGAGTFNLALDMALKFNDDEIVYFVENDYIHKPGSYQTLLDGFNIGSDYMTLYLHPDKFIAPQYGGNPNVDSDGGYYTKIYRGTNCLFGIFDSTTMTFASKAKTLKEDESILRKHTSGTHPNDYQMFMELKSKGRALLCPLESYSTHGETAYLAPLFNNEIWENYL